MGAFDSFAEFISMNGYADYVWSSYGIAALLIVGLVFWSKHKRKQLIEEIKQQDEIKKRRSQHTNSEMSL
ncbi:heme exporter protein CcmD [Catenovulum maritimum]|uniref:Heme exporter protein D n=1 Tax=Catenovulum maritimum TaxID=1513271 RepID=A0A0J8GUC4_9ALTE|nr:heme exporter protein CcmD [Catenovulum maritimum]KMT66347.1 hemagglutination activity protein [Catenovulum maritimum]